MIVTRLAFWTLGILAIWNCCLELGITGPSPEVFWHQAAFVYISAVAMACLAYRVKRPAGALATFATLVLTVDALVFHVVLAWSLTDYILNLSQRYFPIMFDEGVAWASLGIMIYSGIAAMAVLGPLATLACIVDAVRRKKHHLTAHSAAAKATH